MTKLENVLPESVREAREVYEHGASNIETATLETLRAAWEKRAYQAEANENQYRAALQRISDNELEPAEQHDSWEDGYWRVVNIARSALGKK